MTINSRDIKDQVIEALAGDEDDYDLDEIVADLIQRFGRVHVGTMPSREFWDIVADHDISPAFPGDPVVTQPTRPAAVAVVNPVWWYFAAGLVATVLIVTGVEHGYFVPVVRFFVATYHAIGHALTAILHTL